MDCHGSEFGCSGSADQLTRVLIRQDEPVNREKGMRESMKECSLSRCVGVLVGHSAGHGKGEVVWHIWEGRTSVWIALQER